MNYLQPLPSEQNTDIEGVSVVLHVVENGMWLLTDVQVAKAYGVTATTVRRHLQRNRNTLIEGTHWFMKHGKLPSGYPHLRLWTRDGLIEIGNFIKTPEAHTLSLALGVKSRQRTKIESELAGIIKTAFEGIIPVLFQYQVGQYRIDMYFPTLKLAIEIDEHNHESYDHFKEDMREKIITEILGCKLLRFNSNLSGNDVGKLMNIILKRTKM